jgi:TetR/AcrR family transcriptional regulator, tetracycline repressor protein
VGRPAKSLISREGAARAALKVIDDRGLDALSVELVAREMGVRAPSLYYHFKHKAELLEEIARLLLLDVRAPAPGGEDWKAALVKLSVATRRSILRHPNAAPLLLQFFPRHLLLSAYDRWLVPCPLPPHRHMALLEGLEKLTFGSALFEASRRARAVERMPAFDRARLPHLARAVDAAEGGDEALFRACIEAFLDGVCRAEGAMAVRTASSGEGRKPPAAPAGRRSRNRNLPGTGNSARR